MCLISFAWNTHPDYVLALAANRDEFHGRPTAPLAQWADAPDVVGGRDLREGGSWLALSRNARLAAVTNVREPHLAAAPRSRGALVKDFVIGNSPATEEAARIHAAGDAYGPHNLLLWDGAQLVFVSNRNEVQPRPVQPGIHGISNGPYDAPWPKTLKLSARLGDWLSAQGGTGDADITPLLEALADERQAADTELPQTGVGLEMERLLAPAFIRSERYGTRASTVLLIRRDGRATLFERSFGPDKQPLGDVRLELTLAAPGTFPQ
ncbi:MAG: hypothetical protein JWR07_4185 [Nevskia sp.]|nr:hypothetical protein [Nevskia sp.]